MTDQHPITPTPELVQQWAAKHWPGYVISSGEKYIATQAAQWGANQELEACCEWLRQFKPQGDVLSAQLLHHRRPKPQSLAEEALEAIEAERAEVALINYKVINAALKRLQELEGQGQLTKESD